MSAKFALKKTVRQAAPIVADYSQNQSGAAIGARLRRVSERIDADANRIYSQLGVAFEQRWMGVLNQLNLFGPMSVNELAAALAIRHPSVSQTRNSLQTAGLVAERADPDDGRRRILYFTPRGRTLVQKLQPVWSALADAALALNAEAGDTVLALARLEQALARRSLLDRVNDCLADDH
jgi:DNA-binding MarR family transcriptional regulator